MKYLICIVFSVLIFNGCIAQKSKRMMDKIIPQITKTAEFFDASIFEGKDSRYDKITENGLTIYSWGNIGYSEITYFNDSYFTIQKSFYPNGSSRVKGIAFNNDFDCGIWYEFNEAGELTAEINTDEGYDFGWVEVIKYCHKNDIELTKGYIPERSGIHTDILKEEKDGKKVWVICYRVRKTLEYFEVTLDG